MRKLKTNKTDTITALMPANLPADIQAVWRELAPLVDANDKLSAKYARSLVDLCTLAVRLEKNAAIIEEEGAVLKIVTRYGESAKQNPLIPYFNEDFKRYSKLMALFGLTPKLTKNSNDDYDLDDGFDQF